MALTPKQDLYFRRKEVLDHFKLKWQLMYKENYVVPDDYLGIDRNINTALAAYDVKTINASAIEYFKCNSEYYKFHPLKFWVKNITYWVMLSKEASKKTVVPEKVKDDQAVLTKYGISHKGDFYITEDGVIFTKLAQAIASAMNPKNKGGKP